MLLIAPISDLAAHLFPKQGVNKPRDNNNLVKRKVNRRNIMAFEKQYLKYKAVWKVTFKVSKEQIYAADNVHLLGNFY